MPMPHAACSIIRLVGIITVSSAETAMNDAADAARPSTTATMRAECDRSAFIIVTASKTVPP